MAIQIKHRWNGKVLYTAENAQDVRAALEEAAIRGAYLQGADLQGADLRGAYLQRAYLRGADLQGADLRGAYLQRADLRGAYLRGAYLQGADLQRADLRGAYLRGAYLPGADLQGADLRGADGLNPYAINDLLLLTHQVGKIRAYKLINHRGEGPFNGGIVYEIGETYEVGDADCDSDSQCGAGINLATLPWCIKNYSSGNRILLCEFTAKDIAVIPISDGKFRVKKVKVVRELDLAEIGLSGEGK